MPRLPCCPGPAPPLPPAPIPTPVRAARLTCLWVLTLGLQAVLGQAGHRHEGAGGHGPLLGRVRPGLRHWLLYVHSASKRCPDTPRCKAGGTPVCENPSMCMHPPAYTDHGVPRVCITAPLSIHSPSCFIHSPSPVYTQPPRVYTALAMYAGIPCTNARFKGLAWTLVCCVTGTHRHTAKQGYRYPWEHTHACLVHTHPGAHVTGRPVPT